MIFSRKTNKTSHPISTFNTVPVPRTPCQKHLGLYLDEKLSFSQYTNVKNLKADKGIGIIKSLSHILPSMPFITMYKSFIRPDIDYCDIIYDQPNNESFVPKFNKYSTMLPLLLLVQ